MSDLVAKTLERLRLAGVRLEPGLSHAELTRIQRDLGFTFGPEHSELLQAALPVGSPSWPDWRTDSADTLAARLDWPIDGVVFDVPNNAFWPSSWGERPADPGERERRARVQLDGVPRLVPLFGHRYLAVDPAYRRSPVFSVYQNRRRLLRRRLARLGSARVQGPAVTPFADKDARALLVRSRPRRREPGPLEPPRPNVAPGHSQPRLGPTTAAASHRTPEWRNAGRVQLSPR